MTIAAELFTITIGSVLALAVAGIDLQVVGYIVRFGSATRQREEVDTSTTHSGFRCVVRVGR
jgi:hypothetical protein